MLKMQDQQQQRRSRTAGDNSHDVSALALCIKDDPCRVQLAIDRPLSRAACELCVNSRAETMVEATIGSDAWLPIQ